ncbi:polyketide synthase dehydratase domain-containing protein [Streptosporangium lutulentum]
MKLDDPYGNLAERDYQYGPAFQGLRAVWRRDGDVYAEVTLPDGRQDERFGIHPALLDAALHPLALRLTGLGADPRVLLPFSWSGVSLHAEGATTLRIGITVTGDNEVGLTVADHTGTPVMSVGSLALRPASAEQLTAAAATGEDLLYEIDWIPADLPEETVPASTLMRLGFPTPVGSPTPADADALSELASRGLAAVPEPVPAVVVAWCEAGAGRRSSIRLTAPRRRRSA